MKRSVTRHRSVLFQTSYNLPWVDFANPPEVEDEDTIDTDIVSIPAALWQDMGSPSTVTITIEPGDRLNNE